MYLDPELMMWISLAAASACAFMIGRTWENNTRDEIINNTIVYLIENNFINAKKVDGEWEILDLDEK